MRPEILYPLYAPLETLNGVGPALIKTLKRLGIQRAIDLIWHLPTGIAYFPLRKSLKECQAGEPLAVPVTVTAYDMIMTSKPQPARVVCEVDGIPLIVAFFKTQPKMIEARLPLGQQKLVCGTLERFMGNWQITHPERVLPPSMAENWQEKTPLYPLTAGLFQWQAQKFIQLALKRLPDLPEWIPHAQEAGWLPWKQALQKVHAPEHEKELEAHHPIRQRLAFDELFADQLALGLVRRAQIPGKPIVSPGVLKDKILKAFGHPLTPGQTQALKEIEATLASPTRMVRLLQGDVGSGKTLVSFLAIAHAIEAGFQAALLVPTEILATQHMQTLSTLCEAVGIKIELLTGRQKNKAKIYEELAQGHIQLVVGTHALLQETVQFANLGFVVIDEHHRFGVEQRLQLTTKGKDVDVLVMTATPIPRTLCLTSYGDLEVSRILDKPQGRKPIQTRVLGLNRLEEVYAGLKKLLSEGQKIYWVCPLVEESEVLDLAAAQDRYNHLKGLLGEDKVGLVHGKQKPEEKEAAMAAFKDGNCQILVATTVIEVGVDVKKANYIIIEHAERFGLAQLHQLRGRVGRNDQEAHCLLLYGYPLSAIAKSRLSIMKETEDGFRIAEEDFRLRGGGDLLGTKQSGLPSYKLADPLTCGPLLEKAYEAAQSLVSQDPHLLSEQGKAARLLLSLFGKEKAIHSLGSG
jgi:ATP-dependent DNA helicase RecG